MSDPPQNCIGRFPALPRGSLTPRLSVSPSDPRRPLLSGKREHRVRASCKFSPRTGVQVNRRRPHSAHCRPSPWSAPAATTLVRISTSLPAASAPAARPLAIERAGPSRWRWWARSRSRQGASLALGPRPWRGFGLDGSLDRAEDRQLRDGPGRSGPRADICRITRTTWWTTTSSPISFRS